MRLFRQRLWHPFKVLTDYDVDRGYRFRWSLNPRLISGTPSACPDGIRVHRYPSVVNKNFVADIFTKAKRSDVMSRIRSRGNKATELALVRVFRAEGITGWRRHKKLRVEEVRIERRKKSTSPQPSPQSGEGEAFSVRPDFVFPKLRLAIFVDGCFWHGCPKHETRPKNNAAFWRKKFARNIARDRLVMRTLRRDGWRVLRIWEHELARKNEARLLRRIRQALEG